MIKTRLTEWLRIDHPVISAPMAFAAGGSLATSVTRAGGLGLIGGAYGDPDWIRSQFLEAANLAIGCGFITWNLENALRDRAELLDEILSKGPMAMMLSFGDPQPYAKRIKAAGVPLICQVQTLRDAKRSIDCGAEIIVAQGAEAGGHGDRRATMTLVPEVADYICTSAPDVLLCAAGGIADGRGLAAALMLGADGVLVGSRLWASKEARVHPNMLEAAIEATGDDTIRSSVMDIARKLNWPERYTARVLKNAFTEKWHNNIDGLLKNVEIESARWNKARQDGEITIANTFVGEAVGLIHSVDSAEDIILSMIREAEDRMRANFQKI